MDLTDTKYTKNLKARLRRYGYSTCTGRGLFGQYVSSPVTDTRIVYGRGNPSRKTACSFDIDYTACYGSKKNKKDQMGITIHIATTDKCESDKPWGNPDWHREDLHNAYFSMSFDELEMLYLLAKEANERYVAFRKEEKKR